MSGVAAPKPPSQDDGGGTSLRAVAQQLKHRLHTARVRLAARRLASAHDRIARRAQEVPYVWDRDRYDAGIGHAADSNSSTFVVNHLLWSLPQARDAVPAPQAPKVLWALWTGDNPVTPRRRESLDALAADNPDLEIRVVTPANIQEHVVADHPLHPAYERLSYMHRSDYLRAYLMLHHGGVYCDIKQYTRPLSVLVDQLNADPDLWACGAAERAPEHTGPAFGPLGQDQRRYFRQERSQFCFAFKARTPLAVEWVAEVERRLSYFQDLLELQETSQPYGTNPDYPVPWSALMAFVSTPLSLKYHDHVRADPTVQIDWQPGGYR